MYIYISDNNLPNLSITTISKKGSESRNYRYANFYNYRYDNHYDYNIIICMTHANTTRCPTNWAYMQIR